MTIQKGVNEMISSKRLNDLQYVEAKIRALIIARRTADTLSQKSINLDLDLLYDAKYNLLKKLYD